MFNMYLDFLYSCIIKLSSVIRVPNSQITQLLYYLINSMALSCAQSMHSRATWVRKYGMLPTNFGSEKIVCTEYICMYVHPPDAKWHTNTICVKLCIGHPCCDQYLTAVKKGIC